MAKSRRGGRRVTAAKRSTRRIHPVRRGGGVRTIGGDADPRRRESGVASMLPADATPEQLLEVLQAAGDPAELLEQLGEAGLLSSAEEVLAEVLDGWAPLLRPGCDPLSAELAGAEFFGVLRRLAPGDADLAEIVTGMIGQAEAQGTPEAMAVISVLAVLGSGEARPAASGAAARLAAGGLAAPPWAAGLGRPTIGKCFGYVDFFGEQETIALCFSYGRNRHAIGVLIDHVLGGGVKDCFISEYPDQVRAHYRRSAQRFGLQCQDYSPADAASILARALAREPCPQQPDQVEDVGNYLDLLRSRLELLSAEGEGGHASRLPGSEAQGARGRARPARRSTG